MKELINLRKKREKHFLNEDGTITAQIYNEDIHYLKNGEYLEIDNTFITKENFITNKDNDFKIYLSKDKYFININIDKNYMNIILKNHFDKLTPTYTSNEVTYQNALPNIDFIYKMIGKELKEVILLNEIPQDKITFLIDTNLTLELDNDKVLAKSNNEVIYQFLPLFMKDNNDNYYYNCHYKLTKTESYYELELVLDDEWLSNATYPVMIDPTIINGTGENVYDTYISSNEPDKQFNYSKYLSIGTREFNDIHRSLIKFVLPSLGTGDNIINATAYMQTYNDSIYPEDNRAIGVYEITSSWDEKKVTWNSFADAYNPEPENYFYPVRHDPFNVGEEVVSEFDITDLVKRWYLNKENNGVLLKNIDETYSDKAQAYLAYSKTNDANTNLLTRPYLIIQYRDQSGLLDYMTYETISMSKGTTYINNCTGNLVTQISLSEILESNSLISLAMVYNTHDVLLNTNNKLGIGWNISYNESITGYSKAELGLSLKYTTSDGSVHYFFKDSETNSYKDEDGYNLTIEVTSDNNYTMTDKTGNKYYFTNSYLTKLEFVDSESINITRDSENKIIKITDSKDNAINFDYQDNKVTISGKRRSIILNIEDNKLTSITSYDGTTSFIYNDSSIINKIIDIMGMSVGFDYYEVEPYRVKKITQYGLNNKVGKSKTFEYGFNTTTVTDNQNQKFKYLFNNLGNTKATMLVSSDNTLKNTYGFSQEYVSELGTPNTNKLQSETLPISYTENLISNSSFESDDVNNTLFYDYRTTEEARTGAYSVKITSDVTSSIPCNLKENEMYVFSAYIKSKGYSYIKINMISQNVTSSETDEYTIVPSDEFSRIEIPLFPITDCHAISVSVSQMDSSPVYIDDVQLEKGDVANTHNLLSNSNFASGIDEWNVSGYNEVTEEETHNDYEIITLESNETALKLNSNINGSNILSRTVIMDGKKGDVYNLSFMYKNNGVLENDMGMEGNFAFIRFYYKEDTLLGEGTYSVNLNYHSSEWQLFTESYVAEEDYDSIEIYVMSVHEIKEIYVTNFTLTKNLGSYYYVYDDEGNMVSTYDLMQNKTEFKYDKNNQLTSAFNAKGNNFKYEYDNVITNRVLKGISPTGISNEIKYDKYGNAVKTIINNVNPKGKITDDAYYIRSKGTNKYVTPNLSTGEFSLKDDTCSHYAYKFSSHIETETYDEGTIETTVYKVSSSILPKYVLTKTDTNILLVKNGLATNFELIKNNNGSYKIKIYKEDLYLKVQDDKLSLTTLEDDPSFEFYLEDINTNEFIEEQAVYTDDGKYVTKTVDSLGKETIYEVDNNTELLKSITNSKGIVTEYNYNDKDELTSIINDNKEINYTYDKGLISNIKTGNKNYEFEYDEFFNQSKVKINNKTLITNEYETYNGNLLSKTYGNGSKVNYEYDSFNRLSRKSGENLHYSYYYNNLGLLTQVGSYDSVYERFNYDFANRLKSYIYKDKFYINYNYDVNNNINHKDYSLFNYSPKLDYEFNEDDAVVKVKFDDNSLNYEYDYLGRLTSKNINDHLSNEFTYKKNGNKTSVILDTMKIENDTYKYIYDNLYNITKILKNDEIINEYTYDNRSQLLTDINYLLNKKYTYTYDNEGNILTKEEYNLETNELINKDEYKYENTSWEDQLTKFNDEVITYDAIGNPLTIGNKIFKWQNGRQLTNIIANNKSAIYFYNKEGIRTVKEFDDESYINYYTEGTKIIFEERSRIESSERITDMLYYIYDDSANILGFKYNNKTYYYQKNYQNDIIGIYDSNYNLIVKYTYDAWGKVLSITDNNDTIITDENHIGIINPFRYRSYYYDEESKLYYLNSRYYNPEWGRFINADEYLKSTILGSNLYIYTENNSTNNIDYTGTSFKSLIERAKSSLKSIKKANVNQTNNKEVKKYKSDFTFELGSGIGVAASSGLIGVTDTTDHIIKYKKESFSETVESNKGFNIGIDDFSIIEEDGESRIEYSGKSLFKNGFFNISKNSDESTFIGINVNFHFIVGAYVKIGFDITEVE